MKRLMFADAIRKNTTDEETTIVNGYTVCVNPKIYKKPMMQTRTRFDTLDGPGGYQFGGYNPTIKQFMWDSLPSQQAYFNLVEQLRTYKGRKIFLKEGSSGTDKAQEWQPIFVIDVIPKYDDAPGIRHYFASVEMIFVWIPLSQHSHWNAYYHPSYNPKLPPGGKTSEEE